MLKLTPKRFSVDIVRLNHSAAAQEYMFDVKLKIDIGYAGPLEIKGIMVAKFEKFEDADGGFLSIVRYSFDIGVFSEIAVDSDHFTEAIKDYCKNWGDVWT